MRKQTKTNELLRPKAILELLKTNDTNETAIFDICHIFYAEDAAESTANELEYTALGGTTYYEDCKEFQVHLHYLLGVAEGDLKTRFPKAWELWCKACVDCIEKGVYPDINKLREEARKIDEEEGLAHGE